MANLKHNPNFLVQEYELEYRKRLPHKIKIRKSLIRIRDWYNMWQGQVYVSFSGGKDSQVLLHLVRSLYPEVPAMFIDTGLEYPEIREIVKNTSNVDIIKPKYTFKETIEKYGWPIVSKRVAQTISEAKTTKSEILRKLRLEGIDRNGKHKPYDMIPKKWQFLVEAPFKVSDKCCAVMKKRPAALYHKKTGRYPFLGVLASESRRREFSYLQYGCNALYKNKISTSSPLGFWTEQDILRYTFENNLPLAKVYGEIVENDDLTLGLSGISSTGCMWCGFGAHLEKPNRFLQMKVTHPKQYEYIMNKLGMGEVLDYAGIDY